MARLPSSKLPNTKLPRTKLPRTKLPRTKLPRTYVDFRRRHPKVWRAYEKLGSTAAEDGPLPEKVRELVKLGMAAGIRAESALKAHVHRALDAKATPDEVEHAVRLGVTTLGFPGMMTALCWAREAIATHRE